jgi:peptidoglycan hydrolase CwlO-like protein
MMMKKWQTITAATLSVVLTASTAYASLEDDKASYDKQAEELKDKSNALQSKIESLSEEKRLVDEEADAAIAEHKSLRAALDETLERMEKNEARLKVVEADYKKKSAKLGQRVRDIYINGQISYLDVLFGIFLSRNFQEIEEFYDVFEANIGHPDEKDRLW